MNYNSSYVEYITGRVKFQVNLWVGSIIIYLRPQLGIEFVAAVRIIGSVYFIIHMSHMI